MTGSFAMPELPDIVVYLEALEKRVLNQPLQALRLQNPFLLRTYDPPVDALVGKRVIGLDRVGKRIVLQFEDDLFLVIHLMIAGRLHWKGVQAKPPGKIGMATFSFPDGTLVLTEAGSKKRASMHVFQGGEGVRGQDRGGMEILDSSLEQFREALLRENHTVKRSLTDPRLFSGIGNAYSDEILHHARLSPLTWTSRLSPEEIEQLWQSTKEVMQAWIDRLRRQYGDKFPEKVTAFRPEMAVHGRYDQPCPVCGTAVQRIVYADNETNYCPRCQTGGKVLADRSLSRLLKDDWPKTIDEWEGM